MSAYRFYEEEHRLFREAYSVTVSNADARVIVSKMLRHYRVNPDRVTLVFHGNRQSGNGGAGRVMVSNAPTIGLVVHEVAHCLQLRGVFPTMMIERQSVGGNGTRRLYHGLNFSKVLRRCHEYAESFGYWKEELASRATRAREKREERESRAAVANDPVVVRQKKIDTKLAAIARFETKIKRCETYIAKHRRSIARLEVYQRKAKEGGDR